uniref:C3H1-type domain-containing protein n=1 Tax=Noctiluca scintillans TaxID=2966 RepID=A0A7S1ADB6_NOCSC|mmetsp:Transcript_40565/g.107524  ORF Transcript_40565/g.107524 Transcript_40565/m.107524 type:complete len:188 (+) Transcript_40565:37-600(+)
MNVFHHKIWGSADPPHLMSPDNSEQSGAGLTDDLQQHLANNVTYLPDDSSSEQRPPSNYVSGSCTTQSSGTLPESQFQGEAAHDAGTCVPCHFHLTNKGCAKGSSCAFCHLTHARGPTRPCKKKRERCKKTLDMLEAACDPEEFKETAKELSMQSTYLSTVARGKLRQQKIQEEQHESAPPKNLITL